MSEIVDLKRYSSPFEANIEAGLLRDNGIECEVTGENLINVVLPAITEQLVTLRVRKEDEQSALEILSQHHDL